MHCLAEHRPKSGKFRLTKFVRLTGRGFKEQNLFCKKKASFLKKKTKEQSKKSKNVLYLILRALVARARPNICQLSIYQIWSPECERP